MKERSNSMSEPTTDLVRRESTDTWVDVMRPTQALSDYIARTDFVPKAMRGNAPAVTAAILTGRELGWGPMTSLRSLDVIEGSVQMKAKAVLARILRAGHRVEWLESTDRACEVRIERGDGLSSAGVRWTMADAQRAELAGKAVWRRYPRHMLRARALSECAELVCPDVVLGLDISDGEPGGDRQVGGPRPPTVVQAARQSEPTEEALVVQAPAEPAVVAEVPAEELEVRLVSPGKLRLIGALLGEWEGLEGRKLDRVERRRMIGFMAGVDDPDSIASAKDLTDAQADAAVARLRDEIAAMQEAPVDAEIVEDPAQ